jgi:tartrate-resistant acid phosphatase type 5
MRRHLRLTSTRLLAGTIAVIIAVVVVFSWLLSQLYPPPLAVLAPPTDSSNRLRFLAVGRQGYGNKLSTHIAYSMERTAAEQPTHGVFILGDNFYPVGVSSIDDSQWDKKFERLYSGARLRGTPFFAIVGNHDHNGNELAEVEYSRERVGTARWHMDNLFYARDFGRAGGRVLVRVLFLDAITLIDDPDEQLEFAARAFEAPGDPVWRVVCSHYPLRSETHEPYSRARTMSTLLPRFQALSVDLFLSANDPLQQILDRPSEPMHVSTNGGSEKQETGLKPEDPRRDVLLGQPGFAVIYFDERHFIAELRDENGKVSASRERKR